MHFHTRTKTGRAPELDAAEPDAWVELCASDAEDLGVQEGQRVRVASTRGAIEVPVRITRVRPGTVFVPFHYGDMDGSGRAANELTITAWDPVSKQPQFKGGAVSVTTVESSAAD